MEEQTEVQTQAEMPNVEGQQATQADNSEELNELKAQFQAQKESIEKLEANNSKLLGELTKAREVKRDEIRKAAEESGNFEEYKRVISQDFEAKLKEEQAKTAEYADKYQSALKEANENEEQIRSLVGSAVLSEELNKYNLRPELRSVAEDTLKARLGVVKNEEGSWQAQMDGSQSVQDFVAKWAETDTGKAFRAAEQTGKKSFPKSETPRKSFFNPIN